MSLQSVGRVSQHCSISTVQYAAMKLYRCVFEIRMKVKFKHACDPTRKHSVKGAGMITLHRRPTLFLICNLFIHPHVTHPHPHLGCQYKIFGLRTRLSRCDPITKCSTVILCTSKQNAPGFNYPFIKPAGQLLT